MRIPTSKATSDSDQQGLQNAIQKALEKEAKQNGTWIDPSLPTVVVEYLAVYKIGKTFRRFSSVDLEIFKATVTRLKSRWPNLPVSLFEITKVTKGKE